MDAIHDPVFADELIERWGKTEVELVELHASGELNPYICKKIEIYIETGMKIGFGILKTYESCGDEEQDLWYKETFFEWDHNPANTVCYQSSEVMEYERIHSDELRRVALKPQGADARFYKPFWSNGILTTMVEQDSKKKSEDKSVEERKQYTALQEENERLKQELAQVRPPKTANATKKARENRVGDWKGHAIIMSRVAYDCGFEQKREITLAEFKAMADDEGGCPKTAVELLRVALLPKRVTRTTGRTRAKG